MSWQDILKRRGRRIDVKRKKKKKDSVDTGWSKPKIKTDNDVKAEYIDKMINVVEGISHTEGKEGQAYQEPKYRVYHLYFDMNGLAGRMLNEWVLKFLNTLKQAFKQNKSVSVEHENTHKFLRLSQELRNHQKIDSLERLKELVNKIMGVARPDSFQVDSLAYITVHIDGQPTNVYFDVKKIYEEGGIEYI